MTLVAISYDEPDALADFGREFGITFPLLSDPASEIITRFGILNTLIDADDHPWAGLPFPGSYVIGADGVVMAKFFDAALSRRVNADQLLRAATGEEIVIEAAPPPDVVTVDVSFDGDVLRAAVVRDVVAIFRVPAGQHVYGEPVPDGMVATSLEVDPLPGLVVRPALFPPTTPHTLAATGETLLVFEGDVVVRLPVMYADGASLFENGSNDVVSLTGTVRWQSCDDDACGLPVVQPFELTIPVEQLNLREHRRQEGSTRMDYRTHMRRLVERHR